MPKKLTYKEVKKAFNDRGFTLLESCYINNRTKMRYLCNIHGEQTIKWNHFKDGHGCYECGRIASASKQRTSIDVVALEFNKRGYKLLDDEYVNADMLLKYLCPNHGIKHISYGNLMSGKGCAECAGLAKPTYKYVKEYFTSKGYELISNEYINSTSKLDYICSKHGKKSISWGNIISGKGCVECAIENNSGENCYLWQGGITNINNHLRSTIVARYHAECIAIANYTCQLSGIRGYSLEVHHAYAFNSILQDTLTSLRLPVKPTTGEYTEEELATIRDKFIEIQASHESIVLSKPIHKLFHDIYGRGNNTPQQFQEFKERYDNGEFTDILRKTA